MDHTLEFSLGAGASAVKETLQPQNLYTTFIAWQSSLLRDVPHGGIQLMLFEGIKSYILTSPDIDFDVGSLQVR